MTTSDLDARTAGLAARLADALVASGVLRSPEWNAAIRTVPRHLFVPAFVEQQPDITGSSILGGHRRFPR